MRFIDTSKLKMPENWEGLKHGISVSYPDNVGKKGTWVISKTATKDMGKTMVTCSLCMMSGMSINDDAAKKCRYCPRCGAKMEAET